MCVRMRRLKGRYGGESSLRVVEWGKEGRENGGGSKNV